MTADWAKYSLGELTDWFSGGTPSKKNESYWGGDIPWISASSMDGSRYADSNLKITQEGLNAGSRLASQGSILLLVRGSILHKRIPVGLAARDVAFNQDVKAIRVKSEYVAKRITDEQYLYYWIRANEKKLLGMVENTGIGAGKLDTKRIHDIEISLPPWDVQRNIVSAANAIDEKGILNVSINNTLEEIAQALFKSWFVDFEPVKAKIAAMEAGGTAKDAERAAIQAISGKSETELDSLKTENPEQYDSLARTAALFPSAMVESELGEVPEGWSPGTLSEVASIQNGYAFKSKDWQDHGSAVVKIGCVKPGHVDLTNCSFVSENVVQSLDRFELKAGDILVGMTGYPGEIGLVPRSKNRVFLNQRVGRVSPRESIAYSFLYCTTRRFDFKEFVKRQAHGSAQANVSAKTIASYPIIHPPRDLITRFNLIVRPMIDKKLCRRSESDTLCRLRDTLLPKLLSGELAVPRTEGQSKEKTEA